MCIQDSSNIKPKSGGKTSGNKVNDNLKNLNGVPSFSCQRWDMGLSPVAAKASYLSFSFKSLYHLCFSKILSFQPPICLRFNRSWIWCVLSTHFLVHLHFSLVSSLLALFAQMIEWLNSQQPKTRGHVGDHKVVIL